MKPREIQERLIAHGYKVGIDGVIGPETIGALKKFQKSLGLPGTGVPGVKTFAALAASPAKAEAAATSIPVHMEIAFKFLGVKEVPGKGSNPVVDEMFALAGFPGLKDDVPWCAAFVAAMLRKAGLPNEVEAKMRLWAASYARCGVKSARPVYGAIGVKTRTGGGHVGFVVAANESTVWLLGGNQGDKVSIAGFSRSSFTAYRVPTGIDPASLPRLPSSAAGAMNPSQR
jgi:uncharacterized protein (TIGR02594 family)